MPKKDNRPEAIPLKTEKLRRVRNLYPTGKKMAKGSNLDCMGCNPRKPNPSCRGCGGTGYIKV